MITLHQAIPQTHLGGKINSLIQIYQLGLSVPDGLILSSDFLDDLFKSVKRDWQNFIPGTGISQHQLQVLRDAIDDVELPASFLNELEEKLDFNQTTYIVRSSGLLEDAIQTSFAGQYHSQAGNASIDEIVFSVKNAYASLFADQVINYGYYHNLPRDLFRMSILIQEEIDACASGVLFTLDPNSECDYQGYGEIVCGRGAELVDGKIKPENFTIDWHEPISIESNQTIIEDDILVSLVEQCHVLMLEYGYPLDIEFTIDHQGNVYFLQGRPITKFDQQNHLNHWTTTNFRDGGVAAQVCPNLMWSLYDKSWTQALTNFLVSHHFFTREDLLSRPLAHLKFARPYWNLSVVKEAMGLLPTYSEREFDDELGVTKQYQGEGQQGQFKLADSFRVLRIIWSVFRSTRKIFRQAPNRLDKLLNQYQTLLMKIDNIGLDQLESLETLWQEVINRAYLESEVTYFTQVYVNTVQVSLIKKDLLKSLSDQDLLAAIANIGNLSHSRPLKALEDIATKIEENPSLKLFWQEANINQLIEKVTGQPYQYDSQLIHKFIQEYGYHSSRELDLRVACYREDFTFPLTYIQNCLVNRPKNSQSNKLNFSHFVKHLNRRQQRKLQKLKELLWWREEFKDISTRYYALIRWISLKLGQAYCHRRYLKKVEDIFYLTHQQINQYIDGQIEVSDLQIQVQNNWQYCQSFTHFDPPGDLLAGQQLASMENMGRGFLQGISANLLSGQGRVIVLTSSNDLYQVQAGDILVTPFVDTGWTPIFPQVAGIISETGGILSHAAIIAREYDKPMIVGAKQACQRLVTGMKVHMDGQTGIITIIEE